MMKEGRGSNSVLMVQRRSRDAGKGDLEFVAIGSLVRRSCCVYVIIVFSYDALVPRFEGRRWSIMDVDSQPHNHIASQAASNLCRLVGGGIVPAPAGEGLRGRARQQQ